MDNWWFSASVLVLVISLGLSSQSEILLKHGDEATLSTPRDDYTQDGHRTADNANAHGESSSDPDSEKNSYRHLEKLSDENHEPQFRFKRLGKLRKAKLSSLNPRFFNSTSKRLPPEVDSDAPEFNSLEEPPTQDKSASYRQQIFIEHPMYPTATSQNQLNQKSQSRPNSIFPTQTSYNKNVQPQIGQLKNIYSKPRELFNYPKKTFQQKSIFPREVISTAASPSQNSIQFEQTNTYTNSPGNFHLLTNPQAPTLPAKYDISAPNFQSPTRSPFSFTQGRSVTPGQSIFNYNREQTTAPIPYAQNQVKAIRPSRLILNYRSERGTTAPLSFPTENTPSQSTPATSSSQFRYNSLQEAPTSPSYPQGNFQQPATQPTFLFNYNGQQVTPMPLIRKDKSHYAGTGPSNGPIRYEIQSSPAPRFSFPQGNYPGTTAISYGNFDSTSSPISFPQNNYLGSGNPSTYSYKAEVQQPSPAPISVFHQSAGQKTFTQSQPIYETEAPNFEALPQASPLTSLKQSETPGATSKYTPSSIFPQSNLSKGLPITFQQELFNQGASVPFKKFNGNQQQSQFRQQQFVQPRSPASFQKDAELESGPDKNVDKRMPEPPISSRQFQTFPRQQTGNFIQQRPGPYITQPQAQLQQFQYSPQQQSQYIPQQQFQYSPQQQSQYSPQEEIQYSPPQEIQYNSQQQMQYSPQQQIQYSPQQQQQYYTRTFRPNTMQEFGGRFMNSLSHYSNTPYQSSIRFQSGNGFKPYNPNLQSPSQLTAEKTTPKPNIPESSKPYKLEIEIPPFVPANLEGYTPSKTGANYTMPDLSTEVIQYPSQYKESMIHHQYYPLPFPGKAGAVSGNNQVTPPSNSNQLGPLSSAMGLEKNKPRRKKSFASKQKSKDFQKKYSDYEASVTSNGTSAEGEQTSGTFTILSRIFGFGSTTTPTPQIDLRQIFFTTPSTDPQIDTIVKRSSGKPMKSVSKSSKQKKSATTTTLEVDQQLESKDIPSEGHESSSSIPDNNTTEESKDDSNAENTQISKVDKEVENADSEHEETSEHHDKNVPCKHKGKSQTDSSESSSTKSRAQTPEVQVRIVWPQGTGEASDDTSSAVTPPFKTVTPEQVLKSNWPQTGNTVRPQEGLVSNAWPYNELALRHEVPFHSESQGRPLELSSGNMKYLSQLLATQSPRVETTTDPNAGVAKSAGKFAGGLVRNISSMMQFLG